jgi:hypothetical protein
MKKFLLLVTILLFINGVILYYTHEPVGLTLIKKKYQVLLDHIRENIDDMPEQFHVLQNKVIITGKTNGDLGYNMNKGYEIGVCLDGEPNDMFHVLLHELSHSTVEEYDHSEEFWSNFAYLRDLSEQLNIYERITEPRQFCGQYIND